METYSFLRQLADSWVLLGMFGFFLAAIFWAFRPGSSDIYDPVSRIPLRDDAPLPEIKPDTTTQKTEGASDV